MLALAQLYFLSEGFERSFSLSNPNGERCLSLLT